jgi:pimeloyl-ACP methyl ester carboxylesterase
MRTVLPLYFGSPEKPLFGCYHEPRANLRKCAVVICQPIGHEYINCHRALRQLAVRLCDAGFPVFRFDYYGCGDSSGNAEEGSIPQWVEDASTAITEARRRTGLVQVCLIGLRLGGALSVMIGARRGDLESLVLWDPVVNGKSYFEGLLLLQKEMLRLRSKPSRAQKPQSYMDVLGFPFSDFLRAELEKINLLAIGRKPAKNVLVIQSDEAGKNSGFEDHLSHTEAHLQYQRFDAPPIWLPTATGSLLVPSQVLQAVVSWTCRTCS